MIRKYKALTERRKLLLGGGDFIGGKYSIVVDYQSSSRGYVVPERFTLLCFSDVALCWRFDGVLLTLMG